MILFTQYQKGKGDSFGYFKDYLKKRVILELGYDIKLILHFYTRISSELYICADIGMMVKAFAYDPGDLSSIPGRVIPNTQKIVLDVFLFNTQHYKVRIKVKWSNPGKGVSALPYTLI